MMTLREAQALAEGLRAEMAPYCRAATIAGSIRREKPEVGDVEIVAIPRWETAPDGESLFAEPIPVNRLWQWALEKEYQWRWHRPGTPNPGILWVKTGTPKCEPITPNPSGKYWRGCLPCHTLFNTDRTPAALAGPMFDLFLATEENYGLILVIRTGSAAFSKALVTHARKIGRPCDGGFLRDSAGAPVATPDEESVFDYLGLARVPPPERTGPEALRRAR